MGLYLLKSEEQRVHIFGRNPQDIVQLVKHYQQVAKKEGIWGTPNNPDWVRTVPKVDQIPPISSGRINYHVGMINFNDAGDDPHEDFFGEYMQVTPDFMVAVSKESVLYFELQRRQLPECKRGPLYKFQIPGGLFACVNFIPEDVMKAILAYDLRPHLDKGIATRKNIEKLAEGHPNIATAPIVEQARGKRLEDLAGN